MEKCLQIDDQMEIQCVLRDERSKLHDEMQRGWEC